MLAKLSLFCVWTFLKWMRRLMLIWLVFRSGISWWFTSSSLLWHGTRISIMKRFGFLQIKSSWFLRLLLLLLLLLILYVNIIIIGISRVHLIRHIKPTKIRRDKLPTGYFWTSLFTCNYSSRNLSSKLTCFKLGYSLCFLLNSRSSIVSLLFSFRSLVHWIWWLILILLVFLRFVHFSVFTLVFPDLWWSFSCFSASSLSWVTSSGFRTSPVCLDVFLDKFFYFWFSHSVKVRIG